MKRYSLSLFVLIVLPCFFLIVGCEPSTPKHENKATPEPSSKSYKVTERSDDTKTPVKNPPKKADADFGGFDQGTSLEILKIEQTVQPMDKALLESLEKQGKPVVYDVNVVAHVYIDPKINDDAIRVALFKAHDLAIAKVKSPTRNVRQVTVRGYARTKGWQKDLAGGYATLVVPNRTTKPEFTLVKETLKELRGQKDTLFGLTEEARKKLAVRLFQAKTKASKETQGKEASAYHQARDTAFQTILGEETPLRAAFMILEEARKKGWPQQ